MLRKIPSSSSRVLTHGKACPSLSRVSGRRLAVGGFAGTSLFVLVSPQKLALCSALAEEKGDEVGGSGSSKPPPGGLPDSGDEAIKAALAALQPVVAKLGIGGLMGLTSGYALKKIGKMAAFATGCTFVFLQALSYAGFIQIKWGAIEKKVEAAIDMDGDGDFDTDDVMKLWTTYVKPMLTQGLPSAGGFSAGFLMGVKYG